MKIGTKCTQPGEYSFDRFLVAFFFQSSSSKISFQRSSELAAVNGTSDYGQMLS
jgi:hypothetical protein